MRHIEQTEADPKVTPWIAGAHYSASALQNFPLLDQMDSLVHVDLRARLYRKNSYLSLHEQSKILTHTARWKRSLACMVIENEYSYSKIHCYAYLELNIDIRL